MGRCCEVFFRRDPPNLKQSRINLLESNIAVKYYTQNDLHFTYYLGIFDLNQFLKKYFATYKQNSESQSQSTVHSNRQKIQKELLCLQQYITNFQDTESLLHKKIKYDEQALRKSFKQQKNAEQLKQMCMVKIQIQQYQMISDFNSIVIKTQHGKQYSTKAYQQSIKLQRQNSKPIFRQLCFPSYLQSKIKIYSSPSCASLTIDVEDIFKHQVICDIFKLQGNSQQCGILSIRMQFVTLNKQYKQMIVKKYKMLSKQLKICKQGKDIQRISHYQSQNGSVKDTFISDHVSQYMNQYQV